MTTNPELERWNTRFSAPDYVFGTDPNAFLASQAHRLKRGQSALAVADGEGRIQNQQFYPQDGDIGRTFVVTATGNRRWVYRFTFAGKQKELFLAPEGRLTLVEARGMAREAADLVKAGRAPRIKQDETLATYEGRASADVARIDWGKSWRQIDPLVRGCNPAPGAWTMLDGKTLKIFDAKTFTPVKAAA